MASKQQSQERPQSKVHAINEKNFLRTLHLLFISPMKNVIRLKETKLNKNTDECLEEDDKENEESGSHVIKGMVEEMVNI